MPSRRHSAAQRGTTAYLSCDAGSSSYKAALYDVAEPLPLDPPAPRWSGEISWKHLPGNAAVRSSWQDGRVSESALTLERPLDAPSRLLHEMAAVAVPAFPAPGDVDAAVHRIVHAGDLRSSPARVTIEVRRAIAAAAPLAPEHNELALAGIDAVSRTLPGAEQFVISDSAYHADMPDAASTYAVPMAWQKVWGIRRFGFHGISHKDAAQRSAHLIGAPLRALKIVTCHLGNGCSLAATSAGSSVDTTMGWTPLEGLVMGQRSGSVDPGIILYLLERGRYTPAELTRVLNEQSGLRGISGLSGDMREIIAAATGGHPQAALAFDVFTHRLRAAIGAMTASLGGIDALTFTGGIGENAAEVRLAACCGLEFLGLKLDEESNRDVGAKDADIALADSRTRILVVHARETWAMVRECAQAFAERPELRSGTTTIHHDDKEL
jgi:acetate kinase